MLKPGDSIVVVWPLAPDVGCKGRVVETKPEQYRFLVWTELLCQDGVVRNIGFPEKSLAIREE